MRDVRVCQWNTLSLSEDRREDGWEGRIGGGTVPGNSGSRSGAGGGKRLSQWLLVAHWRCTEAFDLSSSLPPPLSLPLFFVCSVSFYRYAPSFSVSSFSPSFLFNSSGVSFCLAVHPSSHPPRSSTHERTGIVCAHGSRPLFVDSFHSVSTRLVSIPPASVPSDPSTPMSPSDHPLRCFVLLSVSPGCDFPLCPPRQRCCSLLRPAFISQQNLRDGTPVPTTINEKLCTKCITTSHVPAAKGHALTSRFFPYFFFLSFLASSLFSSLSPAGQSSTVNRLLFLSDHTVSRIASLPASCDYPCCTGRHLPFA